MLGNPYPDFERLELAFLGQTRPVWRGGEGPAVIVMHEVPGLYPGVVDFARRVRDRGHTVFMPSLVGTPGRPLSPLYDLQSAARLCIMQEFTVLATRRHSPIIDWLRALARHAHRECGGPGVGAVGMCLSGGFALAMMVDDCMIAPVLSQPSLPVGLTAAQKRDLGVEDETLEIIRRRARDEGVCVLGLRFTHDPLVPAERFERLRRELGDNFIAVEIDSSPGNPHGFHRAAHSVLVREQVDVPGHPTRLALEQVLDFFDEVIGVGEP
ncbi:MAG: dienelactone hydrolase family protein [Myxococcales bacterium]|nr:dienelactone hydrolase family protein [Myxococcales bacterium]